VAGELVREPWACGIPPASPDALLSPAGEPVALTRDVAASWEQAWRWMTGDGPLDDDSTAEDLVRWLRLNRPHDDAAVVAAWLAAVEQTPGSVVERDECGRPPTSPARTASLAARPCATGRRSGCQLWRSTVGRGWAVSVQKGLTGRDVAGPLPGPGQARAVEALHAEDRHRSAAGRRRGRQDARRVDRSGAGPGDGGRVVPDVAGRSGSAQTDDAGPLRGHRRQAHRAALGPRGAG
jgi:hypothetical protein